VRPSINPQNHNGQDSAEGKHPRENSESQLEITHYTLPLLEVSYASKVKIDLRGR